MLGPVGTTEAHLAYAAAGIHTNNTAELSSIIDALSFLSLHVLNSEHDANICMGMIQTRTNVPLGLTSQCILHPELDLEWVYAAGLGHCLFHNGLLNVTCSDGYTSIFSLVDAP